MGVSAKLIGGYYLGYDGSLLDISGGSGGMEERSVRLVGFSGSVGSGGSVIVSSGKGVGYSSLFSVYVSTAGGAS